MPNPTDDHLAEVDELITKASNSLKSLDVTSPDFAAPLKNFSELHKIRLAATPEPEPVPEPVVDKDRVRFKDFIPVIASLGGILVIVTFEAFGHTIGSKATAFVSKGK